MKWFLLLAAVLACVALAVSQTEPDHTPCSAQEQTDLVAAMDDYYANCLRPRLCNDACKESFCFIRRSRCRRTQIFDDRYRQLKDLSKARCGAAFRQNCKDPNPASTLSCPIFLIAAAALSLLLLQ
eukprot:CAMPEP_0177655054 /NCGR_PEP_ID=MMETSP0447-20121125/14723_1 /TAXON_ID=0 /ORGANISM="Stygamoeba regulata, Strain BSH-02190019" /LENGTH=125 /DNA_ID=CAMNT_0019158869 /DNA_START=41 /DNA_END=418 /DNA_ORIENTATION=+